MNEQNSNTNTTTNSVSGKAPEFTSMQLEKALDYADHIMNCLPIDFFLMDELANYIYKNQPDTWLAAGSVDTISIGVRRHWITPEVVTTLKTLIPTLGTMPNEWQFDHMGVPIRVTIVERNYTYLQNLDFKFHLSGEYKIPNPFEKYWSVRYLVK